MVLIVAVSNQVKFYVPVGLLPRWGYTALPGEKQISLQACFGGSAKQFTPAPKAVLVRGIVAFLRPPSKHENPMSLGPVPADLTFLGHCRSRARFTSRSWEMGSTRLRKVTFL